MNFSSNVLSYKKLCDNRESDEKISFRSLEKHILIVDVFLALEDERTWYGCSD